MTREEQGGEEMRHAWTKGPQGSLQRVAQQWSVVSVVPLPLFLAELLIVAWSGRFGQRLKCRGCPFGGMNREGGVSLTCRLSVGPAVDSIKKTGKAAH